MNFIPIFPLDVVVFPGEQLNLHIFEPRYKQLIQECISDKKLFGIPFVKDQQVAEYGTSLEVIELVKQYETGEMDIRTKGVSVFRVLEVIKNIPDKLYSGAIVNYPENNMVQDNSNLSKLIVSEVRRLYQLVNATEKLPSVDADIRAYDLAHFVGLSKDQEYELLGIFSEMQRLEYLRRHLNQILPVVQELEEMKARILRNGHFRNLSLKDFNL